MFFPPADLDPFLKISLSLQPDRWQVKPPQHGLDVDFLENEKGPNESSSAYLWISRHRPPFNQAELDIRDLEFAAAAETRQPRGSKDSGRVRKFEDLEEDDFEEGMQTSEGSNDRETKRFKPNSSSPLFDLTPGPFSGGVFAGMCAFQYSPPIGDYLPTGLQFDPSTFLAGAQPPNCPTVHELQFLRRADDDHTHYGVPPSASFIEDRLPYGEMDTRQDDGSERDSADESLDQPSMSIGN